MWRMSSAVEHILVGGNVAETVVRIGSTVRKPATAAKPAVEAPLNHFADVGFSGAPRSLGRDEMGRYILEYIPGEPAYALPALTVSEMHRLGGLVRELHDATESFQPPPAPHWWVVITPDREDLICHPWARLYAEGHGEHWGPAATYIEAHLEMWTAALLD